MIQSSLMNLGMIMAAGSNVKRERAAVVIGCTEVAHFARIFLPARPLLFLK